MIWNKLFDLVYLLASITIVILPLMNAFPSYFKYVPFYKKAMSAMNKLCILGYIEEFDVPGKLLPGMPQEKVMLAIGKIQDNDIGFNELLESIKANNNIREFKVRRIVLAFGDIPIPVGMKMSPNYAVYIEGEKLIPIIFDPVSQGGIDSVKDILVKWIKARTQTKLAIYTLIAVLFWVVVMTLKIYS